MQERILAEREGKPFLLLRDGTQTQHIVRLPTDGDRLTIGRGEGVELALDWDERVSRVHAELERVGDSWAVADDGLSRNGTFVNGKRVRGRQRLEEGDELRLGGTRMVFRSLEGGVGGAATTKVSQSVAAFTAVSDAQRRVLVALCRPFAGGDPWARPATNKDIAAELYLSVPAVKTHLRALFGRFGIEDLGQNEKRLRLAELAFQAGLVSMEDVQGESEPSLGSLVAGRPRRQSHPSKDAMRAGGTGPRRPPEVGLRGTSPCSGPFGATRDLRHRATLELDSPGAGLSFVPGRRSTEQPPLRRSCNMARGDVRIAVTLACEECKRRNYQTNKSKRNNPDRIALRKYCKWCRHHTSHRETR